MNVSQMLFTSVTPLSAIIPGGRRERRVKVEHKRNTVNANEAKRQKALSRYRSAWHQGDEWLCTAVIESRLGTGRSCAMKTLDKWKKQGLIEARHINPLNPRGGFEWRWI